MKLAASLRLRSFSPFGKIVIPIGVEKILASDEKRIPIPFETITGFIRKFNQSLPLGFICNLLIDTGKLSIKKTYSLGKRY